MNLIEYLKLRWFLWRSTKQGFSHVVYDRIIYVSYYGKWSYIGPMEDEPDA